MKMENQTYKGGGKWLQSIYSIQKKIICICKNKYVHEGFFTILLRARSAKFGF